MRIHTFLICYDIPCNKRRHRLSNLLLQHGIRIQKSVFVIHTNTQQQTKLLERIEKIVHTKTDQLIIAQCTQPIQMIGHHTGESSSF